jgi:hypothetical protein
MANEFIARRGFISLEGAQITGSLSATGNISSNTLTVTGNITGAGTSAFATTGSNTFQGNQVVTGSLFIAQNLVVAGSSSIQYISSSIVDIADNIITVNAFNPGVRFGGLAVADSGSSPRVSGSILFDSIKDQWIFVHESSATTSSVLLMGPETYNDLGNETYLSANRLPKGTGIEHLRDSNITDTGTVVSVNSNALVTGSLNVSSTGVFSSNLTTNGKLTVSQASTDFVAEIINTQNATPYGLRIKDAASGANNYPLFSVSNNAGSVEYFRVNSGTGTATFSSSVTANSLLVERTVSRNMLGISSISLPTSGDEEGVAVIKTNSSIWQLSTVGYAADSKGVRFYNNGGTGYTAFEVAQSGGTRFIVNGAGNVGIGTTSPVTALHVESATTAALPATSGTTQSGGHRIRIGTSGLGTGILDIGTAGGSGMWLQSTDRTSLSTNYALLLNPNGGNVGIGTTSPSVTLNVVGNARFEASSGNRYVEIASSTSSIQIGTDGSTQFIYGVGSFPLTFSTNGSERMRITSGGNVGIGTSSADEKLTIQSGNIKLYSVQNVANDYRYIGTEYSSGNGNNKAEIRFAIDGSDTNTRLTFHTANGGGTINERMRITSDGYLRMATNTGGIQFNGDTAAANALDDYEEGTWTPELIGGGGTATYSTRYGWYTKVGRKVTLVWFIMFQKNTINITMGMSGLPFTVLSSNGSFYPQGSVLLDNLSTTTNNITFQAANNSTQGDFIGGNGGTESHTGLPASSLGSGTMNCRGTITYFT